jgi:hypothetical protein
VPGEDPGLRGKDRDLLLDAFLQLAVAAARQVRATDTVEEDRIPGEEDPFLLRVEADAAGSVARGFQDDDVHVEDVLPLAQSDIGFRELGGIDAEEGHFVHTDHLEALAVGFHASGAEEAPVSGMDGHGKGIPAPRVPVAQTREGRDVVDVAVGEGNPHGDHVQDVHAGGDLGLVSSRVDDDAFLLAAGVDVTVGLPRPYDNSFYHDRVKPKGMRTRDQYAP